MENELIQSLLAEKESAESKIKQIDNLLLAYADNNETVEDNNPLKTPNLKKEIFNFISKSEQPLSRREISSRFNISPESVSYHLKNLTEDGLIENTSSSLDHIYRWAVISKARNN